MSNDSDDRDGVLENLEATPAKTPEVAPVAVGVFGSVLDSSKLRFPFNSMPDGDWRDWKAIAAWSEGPVAPFAGAAPSSVLSAVGKRPT